MKHVYFAIILFCLLSSTAILADTKIKSRQTMQGQSFESTTYIKGKRQRIEQNTGGIEMVSVTQCDLRRNLRIMPATKVYVIEPYDVPTETTTEVKSFGLSNVKVAAVGEGLNASELATAIQTTLSQYLKAPNIEVVPLEAALPAAIEAEAKQKECDYVIYTNASHKKGSSGGFGRAFSGVIAPTVGRVGVGHTGSVAGNVAGQVATAAIVSAGTMAASVKAKDEVSLAMCACKRRAT